MQEHEMAERNVKQERILEEKRKNERRMELQSIKHYKKRVKELKQGFPEPKTPPKLTEKELEEQKLALIRKEDEKNDPNFNPSSGSPTSISPPSRKPMNKTFEEIQKSNEKVVQFKLAHLEHKLSMGHQNYKDHL